MAHPPDAVAVDAGIDVPIPDAISCTAVTPTAKTHTLAGAISPVQLDLDGIGPRCDQLQRAILAHPPAELAGLDATTGVGSPLCVEGASYTLIRIDIQGLAGHALVSSGQWLRARVQTDNTLDQIDGWIITSVDGEPSSCASDPQLRDAVIGYQQPYSTFVACVPTGQGVWQIRDADTRTLGDAGWYFDGERMHAVRLVDVGAIYVTPELQASDLACDVGDVGLTLVVDANTGAVLDTRRHCIVC